MLARFKRTSFHTAEVAAILAAGYGAIALSRSSEWHPVLLVALLAVACVAGDWLRLKVGGLSLSGGFSAFVLAISLLGPAPAVAMGALSAIVYSTIQRAPANVWLSRVSNRMVVALIGSGFIWLLVGHAYNAPDSGITRAQFALLVFAVFVVTNTANFAIVALDGATEGDSIAGQIREAFIPMLPGEFVAAALTAVLAVAYSDFTLWSVCATFVVIAIVQSLMTALSRSEDRANQLEARSIHLASLQFGVLATLVETLALRDRSTARHSAAVARYARELAAAAGCDAGVQELAHTAGLLHDIGKFALPDRVLHAEILSDADWALIRRHPQEGATLVGRLDGYGAVAEAILYHHERVDGDGYPVGLIGTEIPLVSRMIAIASTFDTLTARDTYRTPMSPQDAIGELRRVAGRQLDAELVETFIAMIESGDRVEQLYTGEANFEEELEFGRRVKEIATSAT
jgi:putative nucleotidyltransferase with HDIG domain